MIAQIGISLGNWLYRQHVIQESQIDLIRYALEIICSEFLELLIMIVYSFITRQIGQTITFIVIFQLLRKMYDGYHAKTIARCLMITISVYLLVLQTYACLPIEICCLTVFIVLLVQFMWSIKEQKRKPFLVSFTLVCLSFMMLMIGYECMLQILTLTQMIVLLSYLPVRRI